MALVPKDNPENKTQPAFEEEPKATDTVTAEAVQSAAAPTVAATASVPATQNTGALAPVGTALVDPFKALENAYTVEYNTLTQLMASNGNIVEKSNTEVLGDEVTLQLMSWQKNWVISPGDDSEAAKQTVRYSDDGQTIPRENGMSITDYIKELKSQGYLKAAVSERSIIVGALIKPGKLDKYQDTLVQMDLAPTSKALFDRYRIQSAFHVSRGTMKPEQAVIIKLKARIAKNNYNKVYTVLEFSNGNE